MNEKGKFDEGGVVVSIFAGRFGRGGPYSLTDLDGGGGGRRSKIRCNPGTEHEANDIE